MSSSSHATIISSSTKRTLRPERALFTSSTLFSQDRHDDPANHACGLVVEADLAIQLLRQPAVDQARPEALAAGRRHRRAAALLPSQPHPVTLRRRLNPPSNVDLSGDAVRERAVHYCIDRQLVEHQRKGQRRFRLQPNVIALNRETGNPAVVEAKGLQYRIDHIAQAHCLPMLASQQAMSL